MTWMGKSWDFFSHCAEGKKKKKRSLERLRQILKVNIA